MLKFSCNRTLNEAILTTRGNLHIGFIWRNGKGPEPLIVYSSEEELQSFENNLRNCHPENHHSQVAIAGIQSLISAEGHFQFSLPIQNLLQHSLAFGDSMIKFTFFLNLTWGINFSLKNMRGYLIIPPFVNDDHILL